MVTVSDFGVDSTPRKKIPSGREQRIAEEAGVRESERKSERPETRQRKGREDRRGRKQEKI